MMELVQSEVLLYHHDSMLGAHRLDQESKHVALLCGVQDLAPSLVKDIAPAAMNADFIALGSNASH